MARELIFKKSGMDIKKAISSRLTSLQERLDARNIELEKFLQQPEKIRSYILRNTQYNYGGHRHGSPSRLFGKEHISVEEVEEINQMCKRIMELENEINSLKLVAKHLNHDQSFDLGFEDLIKYGFSIDAKL
ncbi:hypothetical protein [Aureispira sp. CCB-QB1]|uniref:hypothetical protein n=1 Tax=Aureispira sp. CCB-QB1 TaxID=1313421 RepID=UPI000697F413|nr:hypothetical protein [Aureispira sp. CCB-QB1]